MLPKEAVSEFQKIYENRFGVKLNYEDASRRANNLVNLYKAVYGEDHFGLLENVGIKDQLKNQNE